MRILALGIAAAVLGARAIEAQTLYAFDPTLRVTEISGPPVGPCGYPDGPVFSGFPTGAGLCPTPFAFAPPLGDVAVDPITDSIYVTDGAVIAEYSRAGAYLGFGAPPIAGLTGMAVGGGMLWITNGAIYGAVPLAPIACPAGALAFVVGPFPVPIGPIFAGPISDLDFEAATGSLIGCDGAGTVGSFMPGFFPVLGPYGAFLVAPIACLGPGLQGIAFDKARPGTGTVYVSDGVAIARMLPGAVPAPPTFYSPVVCRPSPTAAPLVGLAYAGRQITYGVGLDSSGLPAPTIGSVGQSYVGNPAYGVTLTGSVPGGTALLRYSLGAMCPPGIIAGVPVYLAGPRFPAVTLIVGAGGSAGFATPIPAAFPVGVSVFLQWIVLTGSSIQVTSGAELTTTAL